MNPSDLDRLSTAKRHPERLPTVAGFLTAGVAAWFVSSLPLLRSLSVVELVASAVERALAVFIACSVLALAVCVVATGMNLVAAMRLALTTSMSALWLAPLAIFIREHSPWSMAMAAVFVAGATYSSRLVGARLTLNDGDEASLSRTKGAFALLESSAPSRRQATAACAALCAQTGALAGLAGYTAAGVSLTGISSAVWTMSFINSRPADQKPSAPSESTTRAATVFALVILCTAAGLMPYLKTSYRLRFGVPSRTHAHRGFPKGGEPGQRTSEQLSGDSVMGAKDAHAGIILWPAQQKHTKLVAPPPALGSSLLRSVRSADPLIIPFDGVYWFFKAPDTLPPKTSQEVHGSPELFDIRSTDRHPLSMEAHENLGSSLDLNCCSKVQIAIRNRDRYPETVSLELILIDTTKPGKPSQSLGTMMVKSTPPWDIYAKRPPTNETLDFVIPPRRAIRRFDEVIIVFRLDAARADAGAKIAIDRFVLVPRGY
jgi:hypothetical protein